MELVNKKPLIPDIEKSEKDGLMAVLSSPRHFEFREIEFDSPAESEILVRMDGCGLCASNIPIWQGRPWFNYPLEPGAPGHEGWGTIIETGSSITTLKVGQRVSLLNGNAFSTHVLCNASQAVAIPESLSEMPLPGEPIGCAINIFERSDIKKGQFVAILGIGFLGAALVQLIKAKGAKVICVSRRESSLSLAQDMGADKCFTWDQKEEIHHYLAANSNGGCERVIECVGNQKALDLATELVKERGKLIIAGYHQEDLRHINMQIWNWKGIDVINAHEREEEVYKSGIRKAIKAIESGELELRRLLTHEFEFSQLNEAMNMLTEYPDGFTKAYINYNI